MKRLVFALALLLTACGSDTGKGNGSTGGGSITSPEQVAPALWGELCNAAFNCPDVDAELAIILGRYPNAAACAADTDGLPLDFEFEQTNASIAEGRSEWDSARADECIQKIRESLCSGLGFENVPECSGVIVGLVPEGQFCVQSEECQDGLDCDSGGEDTCYGTCRPNCGDTSCGASEYCDTGDVCTPRQAAGTECIFDGQCQDSLICEGTCVATRNVVEGGECNRTIICESGLQCVSGTCTSLGFIAAGQSCEFSEDIQQICEPGTVCTDFTISQTGAVGTCGPPKAMGEPCRVFLECQPGLTCSTDSPITEGECVAQYADGAACNEDFDCQSQRCFDGTCEARTPEMVCQVPTEG